jgi:hypothetical protein
MEGRIVPKATILTAFMSQEELLKHGFTLEDIELGHHLPRVGGAASNSTQLITDMTSAINNQPYSATATANAIAAAGPIEDLNAMVKSVLLNFQEAQMKLNYILGGSMTAPASLTAPTGGLITTSSDSATYNLLVGIFQILK